jgi:hypothetical protein
MTDEELYPRMRALKTSIEQKLVKLDGPKADVASLKQRVTSELGLHGGAFNSARVAANRKPAEARSWFDTVLKSGVAYGVWDQGDLVEMAKAYPHVPLPTANGEAAAKVTNNIPVRGRPRRDRRPTTAA